MNRGISVRLAAALLPMLVALGVIAFARAAEGSGVDSGSQSQAAQPVGFDNVPRDSQSRLSGIQECRAGPSKCTGQPGLVSATSLYDQLWTLAPSSFVREILSPDEEFAPEAPTYRMKPPPRET